jgi:hypothetical protein
MRRQSRTVVICEISCLNVSTQPRDEKQGDAHLDIRNNILYIAQATVRLRDEKETMRRRTKGTSAVRRNCAFRGIRDPIEALLQPGILDECTGIIRVRLCGSTRGVGTRTRTGGLAGVISGAAVSFAVMRYANTHTHSNCDNGNDANNGTQYLRKTDSPSG